MLRINTRSSKPIYEQIIDGIKENVLKEYLLPGDEIPSVRKMAVSLSVTPNTVSKAYQELERQHIIETIRGKGTYIAAKPDIKLDKERLSDVKDNIKREVVELIYMGLNRQEILELVTELYSELSKEEGL